MGIVLAPGVLLEASARPPISERQNKVKYLDRFGIGGFLLAGLEVSLSSLWFTVELVFLLMGCTSAELFSSLYPGLGFLL